jgi:GWxTD domain-containing protein
MGAIAGMLLFVSYEPILLPSDKHNDQNAKQLRRRKAALVEVIDAYYDWLRFEVPYIITYEEKAAFKKLSTDDEREQFIEQFWERRNPIPGSLDNAFKDEYYRRIAFANQMFSDGILGWRTDRGRIYVQYGPPDEIKSHPNGGFLARDDTGTATPPVAYPFEEWRYGCLDGIGKNVVLDFVDPRAIGEYHLTVRPEHKDQIIHILRGMDSFLRSPHTNLPELDTQCHEPLSGEPLHPDQADDKTKFNTKRVDLYIGPSKPPDIKFKDLQGMVLSKISQSELKYSVLTSFVPATEETTLTAVTIQIPKRHLKFVNISGAMHGGVEIYGQFTSLSGRVVSVFEKELDLDAPDTNARGEPKGHVTFQNVVPLRHGQYKLSLVLKDKMGGEMGTIDSGIRVPRSVGELGTSPIILADHVELLSATDGGQETFVIGGAGVIPNVCREFKRDQNLEMFSQVTDGNLSDQAHRPDLNVNYTILHGSRPVMELSEDPAKLAHAAVVYTIDKKIPLTSLEPGLYTLKVTVTDNLTRRILTPSATFRVIEPSHP